MLSKKDKEWIEETFRMAIRKECRAALYREITLVKKGRHPEDPEIREETRTANILDVFVEYLPLVEGALRGLQEDCNKANNKSLVTNQAIEQMAQIFMSHEKTMKTIAEFSEALRERKKIIGDSRSAPSHAEIEEG